LHFLHVVLETPQRGDLPSKTRPHLSAGASWRFAPLGRRSRSSRPPSDLGNVEHLFDRCPAHETLLENRRQESGHGQLNVLNQIVDDVIVSDVHLFLSASSVTRGLARTLNPMMIAPEAEASMTSVSEMAPVEEWMILSLTSSEISLARESEIARWIPARPPS